MWAIEFWGGDPEADAFCVEQLGKGGLTGQGIKVIFSGKLAIKVDLVLIFFPYRFLSEDQVLIAKCHTADAN